jgi:hypothetical protein
MKILEIVIGIVGLATTSLGGWVDELPNPYIETVRCF